MSKIQFPIARPGLMPQAQVGRVVGIVVRPGRGADVREVSVWDPSGDDDHGRVRGKRAVTLFQHEHIAVIEALTGRPFAWSQARRNVLVTGINLLSLVGQRFSIGGAHFKGTCLVDPCFKIEQQMGADTYGAMMGHGGVGAKILHGEELNVGDPVRWLGPIDQA